MMQALLASWNAPRLIRLALGILALVQWFRTNDNIMLFAGGFLVVTAFVNIGCGSGNCAVSNKTNNSNNELDQK